MSSSNTTTSGNKTSKFSSSSDERRDVKHRTRCQVNPFLSSIRSNKRAQRKNANKCRIRNLDETAPEETHRLVIITLNTHLRLKLTSLEVVYAERVSRWDNDEGPRDITVTFANVSLKQKICGKVYDAEETLPFTVVEELCDEMVEIYKKAVLALGDDNVLVCQSLIFIAIDPSSHSCELIIYQVRCLIELNAVLSRIYGELYLEPRVNNSGKHSRRRVTGNLSSTQKFKFHPNAKRPQKRIRIRKIPENPKENLKLVALETIRLTLSIELESSEIESCKRVVCWDGSSNPRDIVVKFRQSNLPLNTRFRQQMIQCARSIIIDDLSEELAEVYTDAIDRFGDEHVYTLSNSVVIEIRDDYVVAKMTHYKRICDDLDEMVMKLCGF